MEFENSFDQMQKEIRAWGLWSLVLGGLHLIASGFLDAPWGILLIVVGVASFYFRTASMFIVYAVTLAWAALSNLASGEAGWIGFAVFQIILAFRVVLQYRHFRQVEVELAQLQPEARTEPGSRWFPWIGSILGCSAVIGLALIFAVAVALAIIAPADSIPDAYLAFAESVIVDLGLLGAAVCLASLLSRHKPRGVAIVGLLAASLTLLVELIFYAIA